MDVLFKVILAIVIIVQFIFILGQHRMILKYKKALKELTVFLNEAGKYLKNWANEIKESKKEDLKKLNEARDQLGDGVIKMNKELQERLDNKEDK